MIIGVRQPVTAFLQGFIHIGSVEDTHLPLFVPVFYFISLFLQTAALFRDIEPLACGPCLVHSDLHPGNVLLDKDFQLLAVVDWEEAAISDLRVDVAQACLACDNRVRTGHCHGSHLVFLLKELAC